MAEIRTQAKEEAPLDTCVIPENFADTGRCFNGLFRTRNLVEGVIIAAPFAYVTTHLGLEMNQTIVVTAVVAGGVLVGCIVGINGDSITEWIMHVAMYFRHKRVAKYNPRVKNEATPGYLTKERGELPVEKIRRLAGQISNKMNDQETVSSEIYDPIYKEFFEDDLGYVETPDDLKSRKERRQERKEKKKAEKQKRKEEAEKKAAEKKAKAKASKLQKKADKLAAKEAKLLAKHEAKTARHAKKEEK